MSAVGARRSKIYDYLLEHDQNAIQVDVDNMLQLPVIDVYGYGRIRTRSGGPVVSLLEANGDWHMEKAVTHFKRLHPICIDHLRVIVVDKNLNEIKVLEANFPKALVLICHIHVIKYLKEKRSKPKYGKVSSDGASQVDAAIHAMVYSQSEDQYKISHDSLKGICDPACLNEFFNYFEKNWDASQDRWVMYRRSKLPRFKNHINNRCMTAHRRVEKRTSAQRYRVAVRTTHLICTEMADIEDEEEFGEMLQFVEGRRATEEESNEQQPSLLDTQRRLPGVIVKFSDADNKKPKLRMMKNPVANSDAFYLLPHKLLEACVKVLPVSNTASSAIVVDASQEASQEAQTSKKTNAVKTVVVKDIGNFSREQVETFGRVKNLGNLVQLGLDMHKWITVEGIPALPAAYHDLANKVAVDVVNSYPFKPITGRPETPEFTYLMLYRAIPPTWLSDASINGLCLCLMHDFPSYRFAGFQDATPTKTKTRNSSAVPATREIQDGVFQQVSVGSVECVLVPLNFHNAHWCCLVVQVSTRRIFYYNPLNQALY
ncbi:hypothetical protein PHMEG_0009353 [Phytophthora megakarya]|uniref:Uncharacterized protein n=1 Tax=Phytophthora megakarya TaxID=4795 RepID=A0A225WGE2_9STRA|nr:hypothetical protein PHMEG_0009353 [Phytophthora megakarya]